MNLINNSLQWIPEHSWMIFAINFILTLMTLALSWLILHKKIIFNHLVIIVTVLSFLIPIIAPLYFIFFAALIYYLFTPRNEFNFSETNYPEYLNEKSYHTQSNQGSTLALLNNPSISDQKKLQSLIEVNHQTNKHINEINQLLLHNDNDEIRLFAYSKLNHQLTELYEKIHFFERKLPKKQDSSHLRDYKILMYYYWELFFLELVKDELKNDALEKLQFYTNLCYSLDKNDLDTLIIQGRIALLLNQLNDAESYFITALNKNAPINKVLPYLVEITYKQKAYHKLSRYVNMSNNQLLISNIRACINFWQKYDGQTTIK